MQNDLSQKITPLMFIAMLGFIITGISITILLKYEDYYDVSEDGEEAEYFVHPLL